MEAFFITYHMIRSTKKILEESKYQAHPVSDDTTPNFQYIGSMGPHFGRLPLAYRLTTRNQGVWVWNDEIECALMERESDFWGERRMVLVRPVGNESSLVQNIARITSLFASDQKTTIVKAVLPQLAARLEQHGLTEYRKGDGWSRLAKEDDQTYPENIVCLDELAERKGGKWKGLRNDLSRAERNGISLGDIDVERIRIGEGFEVTRYKSMVDDWLEDYMHRHPSAVRSRVRPYYDALPEAVRKSPVPDKIQGLRFMHGEKLIGGSFSGLIDREAEVYIVVSESSKKSLGTIILMKTLLFLRGKGATFVNISGSETDGLDFYKRKFNPCKRLNTKHIIRYANTVAR